MWKQAKGGWRLIESERGGEGGQQQEKGKARQRGLGYRERQ